MDHLPRAGAHTLKYSPGLLYQVSGDKTEPFHVKAKIISMHSLLVQDRQAVLRCGLDPRTSSNSLRSQLRKTHWFLPSPKWDILAQSAYPSRDQKQAICKPACCVALYETEYLENENQVKRKGYSAKRKSKPQKQRDFFSFPKEKIYTVKQPMSIF